MNTNISLQDLCFLFKIDFISLLQPGAAVIKSNEANEPNTLPLPFRNCVACPFCSQRGDHSLKCCISFSHPHCYVNMTDPQVFIELFYVGTKKDVGTVTDPAGGPEEKNAGPIG